jgi:arylformamidase
MMRRRAVLAGLGLLPVAGVRAAPVFLDYTQDQLNRAYDQSVWAPDIHERLAQDAETSAAIRRATPPNTVQYGPASTELMDVFAPAGAHGAPVMVFIHGGAWLRNSRLDASFPAPTFMGRGAAWLAPDFGSLSTVRLPDMVASCTRAVEWAVRNAASFGGDPARVFIGGHSSGAHLAGCVLLTDWTARGLPPETIRGALLMSGMYDLYPVLLSSRSSYVHVSPEEAAALSAMRHLDRINCPVAVLNGDGDTPEFKRQSAVFADALRGMGRLAEQATVFNANHFQELEHFSDPASDVSQAAFKLMGI